MNKPRYLPAHVMALAISLIAPTSIPGAQAEQPAKPMALRSVMQELGRDMQAVTGAISKEDWATVAHLAPKIARHAEPPLSEKTRILGWLGADVGKFRGYDGELRDAAVAMGEAATRGEGREVIAVFGKVQQRCLACHQAFRKPFQVHFYGKR